MAEKQSTIESAVIIPGLQSIVTGALAGAAGFSLALAFHGEAFTIGAAAFSTVTLGAWLFFRGEWRTGLNAALGVQPVQVVEPAKSYPNETVSIVKLSIDWDEGRAGLFDDLRIDDETFIRWAVEVFRGKSLGENHWTGATNPFSKGQYHAFLNKMIYLGMVRQAGKARTSGYELTGKGRAVMRAIEERYGRENNNYQSRLSPTGFSVLPSRAN